MPGKRLEQKPPRESKPFFTKKRLLYAALALCVCVMAGSLFYLGRYYYFVLTQRNMENQLDGILEGIRVNNPPPNHDPAATPPWQDDGESGSDGEDEESERDRERRYLMELVEKNREVYAELLEINEDWLGTVEIPGLLRMQHFVSANDNEEYLFKDFYGRRSLMGTIFLNTWNDRLLMDNNNVLYGHNIRAGGMFSRLLDYKDAGAFKRAPVVVLDGLAGESVWIIFAAYVTEPDWGYVYPANDPGRYSDLLAEIKERSWFITDVDVDESDRILTLSTCDYTFENMRFAVHARKLRPGEEIPAEVTALPNPDRKQYSIPNQIKLSDVEANRAAVMLHPANNRLYFYQLTAGGIEYFAGNTSSVQGPYTSFTGAVSANSYLSAIYDSAPADGERRFYLAADNYNRQTGIQLLSVRLASNVLVPRGTVTPQGADARYPALISSDGDIWLLYTVVRSGGEDIYRRLIRDNGAAGEPELLRSFPINTNARALGYYVINGVPLLFWHETAAVKRVRGAWEDNDPFNLQLASDADRITFYGELSNNRIRAAVEKNGRITFHDVQLSSLPVHAPVTPETPAPPEPSDDPPDDPGDNQTDPGTTDGDGGETQDPAEVPNPDGGGEEEG
jgi:sortase B